MVDPKRKRKSPHLSSQMRFKQSDNSFEILMKNCVLGSVFSARSRPNVTLYIGSTKCRRFVICVVDLMAYLENESILVSTKYRPVYWVDQIWFDQVVFDLVAGRPSIFLTFFLSKNCSAYLFRASFYEHFVGLHKYVLLQGKYVF